MALWFAELRARAVIMPNSGRPPQYFIRNNYLTRADRSRQQVLPAAAHQRPIGDDR
jgi:hypothetical protein